MSYTIEEMKDLLTLEGNDLLENVDLLIEMLQQLLSERQEWVSVEEYNQEANEGWCWIVYKDRVTEAYHDHDGRFRFSKISNNLYMTECISAVMSWPAPPKPE